MNAVVRFKYHYHVEVIDEGVLLFSEDKTQVLKGNAYKNIAPYLLEGRYTEEEIVSHLQGIIPLPEIYFLLFRLESKGYVEKINPQFPDFQNAYCSEKNLSLVEATQYIFNSKVFIKNLTQLDISHLYKELNDLKIGITESIQSANFVIVATDHYLRKELEELQKELFDKKIPWLLFKPIGSTIWIGPLFNIGEEESCWFCLKERLKINLLEETYVQRKKNKSDYFSTSKAYLSPTLHLAFSLISIETFKWISAGNKSTELKNQVKTFDTQIFDLKTHHLSKRPQCPCCGNPELVSYSQPLILKPQKSVWNDGGDRSIAPDKTIKQLEYLISPITGVLKYISKSDVTPEGIHVYSGGFNFAQCNFFDGILKKNLRSSSAGKGETDMQAKASCICEAIERHCGVFQGDECRVKTRYEQIKSEAIHPKEILFFSQSQHKNRDSLNQGDEMHRIPCEFMNEEEIEWTPAWSMNKKKFLFLPTAFCYYNYPIPENSSRFCYADSNGNSAGNTLEEAILQGLFELIERDSIAIWWYNRLSRPGVDLQSFKENYFDSVVEEYQRIGRELWVLDITHDLGIPSFVAVSAHHESPYKILLGFGSHLNPKIAIKRAITELGQSLPIAACVDKERDTYSPTLNRWMLEASLENQSYLKPLQNHPFKRKEDYPKLYHKDLLDDINKCHQILQNEGLDILVLNQSRLDIPLSVVKVIVPGLRHFWPQFAPGRLYDVPIKMGWLQYPLKEDELNPIPMFL